MSTAGTFQKTSSYQRCHFKFLARQTPFFFRVSPPSQPCQLTLISGSLFAGSGIDQDEQIEASLRFSQVSDDGV